MKREALGHEGTDYKASASEAMSLLHKRTSYGKIGSICVDFEHLFEVW